MRKVLKAWIDFCRVRRSHFPLDDFPPDEIYSG